MMHFHLTVTFEYSITSSAVLAEIDVVALHTALTKQHWQCCHHWPTHFSVPLSPMTFRLLAANNTAIVAQLMLHSTRTSPMFYWFPAVINVHVNSFCTVSVPGSLEYFCRFSLVK